MLAYDRTGTGPPLVLLHGIGMCKEVWRPLTPLLAPTREVIAVDLPTGVDADTGVIARRAVRADLTVTFGAAKRGHLLYPGRAFSGRLEVVDIGLRAHGPGAPEGAVEVATAVVMGAPALVKEGLSWREVRLRALHSTPVSLSAQQPAEAEA